MAIPVTLSEDAKNRLDELIKQKNIEPKHVDGIISYCRDSEDQKPVKVSESLIEEAYQACK